MATSICHVRKTTGMCTGNATSEVVNYVEVASMGVFNPVRGAMPYISAV